MGKNVDQHEVILLVKELASELQRIPTHVEFQKKYGYSKHWTTKHFGSWKLLIHAAGFGFESEPAKIDNSIFEADIETHLENYKPREVIATAGPIPTMASISDIHFPFHNSKVIGRFIEYIGDEKPQKIILNGDAWDMYSHTKFPRSHNVFTPRDEQAKARELNEKFWQDVKKASPGSECYQMLGNHDIRPLKRIMEEYPEAEDWVQEKLKALFTYEGVKTIYDPREELIFGNVAIFHGYRSKLGDHRDYTHMCTINGHTHVGGVVFRRIRGTTLWELNSGLAGDPEAKGLTYTPQKITNWTFGFGAVNKHGPQFIPV